MNPKATPIVGVTGDLLSPDGSLRYPALRLGQLERAAVTLRAVGEGDRELDSEELSGLDAVLVFGPRVTARSLRDADRLLVVARLGVGLDNIDIEACSQAGVVVTVTPDAIRRPMASAAAAFTLALAHRLTLRDRLVRQGHWDEATSVSGVGLTDKVFGLIGYGNVAREVVRLLRPFGLRFVASDPYVGGEDFDHDEITMLDLDTVVRESDFVCVACPLTPETYHLLDEARLRSMKNTAYLINVARGPIIDQRALTSVLSDAHLAGAALDVFEHEPLPPTDPILTMSNVIVASHSIGFTDELMDTMGASACEAVIAALAGRVPKFVVNPEVLDSPQLRLRLIQEDPHRLHEGA